MQVPCRIETLLAFAERNNLKFLEDACQCVGGKYKVLKFYLIYINYAEYQILTSYSFREDM